VNVSSASALPLNIPGHPNAGEQGVVQVIPAAPAKATGSSATPLSSVGTAAANHDLPTTDRLAQAVKQANDSFNQKGQNLYASFEKDKLTGISVVKIVDKKTNETVSQMPSRQMVAFAQYLEDPQGKRGQLVNTQA